MRTRTTILLALALLCASVFAWIDKPPPPLPFGADPVGGEPHPDQAPGEGIIRLLSFETASVTRITIQRGTFNATLTRTDAGWNGITDSAAVEDFLRNMQAMAQIIVVGPDQGGPSDYGLEPAVARITMERSTDEPIDVRLGNPNPTSTGLYAQVGAHGPVVLTGALALWDLDKVVRLISSASSAEQTPTAVKEAQP